MLEVSALPASHITALQDAAVLLTRYAFEAVGELRDGLPFEDTWLAEYLPMRYRSRYDEGFARHFVTCLVTVSGRLWSSEAYRPRCVAEQLAFCALVEFAQATLEERRVEPDFGSAWDRAFDDLGVKTLFDASHAVEPRLEFGEWFRPLDVGTPVHPSIRFQDRVLTRIS
jgi:hypothetical protein